MWSLWKSSMKCLQPRGGEAKIAEANSSLAEVGRIVPSHDNGCQTSSRAMALWRASSSPFISTRRVESWFVALCFWGVGAESAAQSACVITCCVAPMRSRVSWRLRTLTISILIITSGSLGWETSASNIDVRILAQWEVPSLRPAVCTKILDFRCKKWEIRTP